MFGGLIIFDIILDEKVIYIYDIIFDCGLIVFNIIFDESDIYNICDIIFDENDLCLVG